MDTKEFKSMDWWKRTGVIDHLCDSSTAWVNDYSNPDEFYKKAPARELFNSIFFRNNTVGIGVLKEILNFLNSCNNYTGDLKDGLVVLCNPDATNDEINSIKNKFETRKKLGFYTGPIDRVVYRATLIMLEPSDIKSVLMLFHYLNGVVDNNSLMDMDSIRQLIHNIVSKDDWYTIVKDSGE